MRKVLIVDDEFLVRLGLKTTINWQEYGYSIVGEASNAQEALRLFDECRPDILLTDIKMPGIDGLELISEIKRRNKKIKVVILTNYNDFDYARKAMQLGASQYFLKSEINEKSLLELLKTLSVETADEHVAVPDDKARQVEYLRNQIFDLRNTAALSPDFFTAPEKSFFDDTAYVILKCSCDISQLSENLVGNLTKMLSSLIDSHFHQPVYYVSCFDSQLQTYIICSVSHIQGNSLECLTEQGKMLARNIKQYSNVCLFMGLSLPGSSERFPQMFVEAVIARQNTFFQSEDLSVFRKDILPSYQGTPKISYSKLNDYVVCNKREDLRGYISDIFVQLSALRNYQYVKNSFIDFLSIAKTICEKYITKQTFSVSPDKFNYDNLNRMESIQTVEKYIYDLYGSVFDVVQNVGNGYSHTVKNCLAFIEKNFSSNISLEDAAKATDISLSYLSLIFKQEMGINFSSYLTERRINCAKELLSSTNMKIYEIAEKVGFASPYYFSKVFRDTTKMTCKEYKDRFAKI